MKKDMNKLGTFTLAVAVLVASSYFFQTAKVFADETVQEKVENTAGDVKTDAKKARRAAGKRLRKAKGTTDSVAKDAKDKAQDVGDDISNGVDKAKRKAE